VVQILERQEMIVRNPIVVGIDSREVGRHGNAVFLVILLGLAGLCGCSGPSRQLVVTSEFHPFTEDELIAREQLGKRGRYRLRPGDTISIDFKYQDELDRSNLLVLPDGYLSMVGVHDIKVAGLTVNELDEMLTRVFSQEYKNPDLAVIIESVGDDEVYVYGEVNRPGAYVIPPTHFGVLQAISLAGGFGNHASTSEILILRVKENGYEYRIADISHLEKRDPFGMVQLDIQPNDIIYVPRNTLGDIRSFSESFLAATLRISDIFWDIYGISHLNKVDRIVR